MIKCCNDYMLLEAYLEFIFSTLEKLWAHKLENSLLYHYIMCLCCLYCQWRETDYVLSKFSYTFLELGSKGFLLNMLLLFFLFTIVRQIKCELFGWFALDIKLISFQVKITIIQCRSGVSNPKQRVQCGREHPAETGHFHLAALLS